MTWWVGGRLDDDDDDDDDDEDDYEGSLSVANRDPCQGFLEGSLLRIPREPCWGSFLQEYEGTFRSLKAL